MGFFFTIFFVNLGFVFNGICYCGGYQGLDVKEEHDFDITYGACLSRSLFIICRKCSMAIFESGLLLSVLSNWFWVGR